MIKFQLLATKVGNTIKTVGTYWILDSIQWQGYLGTARVITRIFVDFIFKYLFKYFIVSRILVREATFCMRLN